MPPLSTPCQSCNNLDMRGHEEGFILKLANIQETCKYCSLLLSLVHHFAPSADNEETKGMLRIDLQHCTATNVEIMSATDDHGSSNTLATLWVYRRLDTQIPKLPTLGALGLLSTRLDSDECFAFIHERIQNCYASHSKCRGSFSTPLPKRVLSIGSTSKDAIKLVEPSGIQAAYIALSHCWGGLQPIKTISSSLAEMQANIEWNDLSRVFQDAITVARRLGIEWIWIDSLCIIQDSKADWEIESAKMCDYYSNAYLTISASSSKNGTIPFLHDRGSQWQTEKFPFSSANGQEVEILARRHTGSSMAQVVEDLSPLASRAWCWQENVLSTRVLHYTQSELIFECRTEVVSEDGAKPRGLYSMGLAQKFCSDGGKERDTYRCWHDLIESYSIRELTFESDKLPAVSGVAKQIQGRTNSVYLAGLWKDNLPMDLCWSVDYVSTNSSPNMQPETYIAPSWCWASVNGALDFVSADQKAPFTSLVTVLDVHVSVSGLNKYGEVQGGYIMLKGMVSEVSINCTDPSDCWSYTVGNDPMTREPIAPDCALCPCEMRSGNSEGEVTLRRAQKGDILVPFEVDLYCVHVGKQVGDNDISFYGMVIARSHLGDGTYVRIGLIQLDDETWFEKKTVEMVVEIR
ncbi:heterokaryon incompatibility protein-domain-containing protein [Halenospora varia]|nr:heterokaryon incompatibility protein-domain-containing protein [Halenospora varia]